MSSTYDYQTLRLEPLAVAVTADMFDDVLSVAAERLLAANQRHTIGFVAVDADTCRRFRIDPTTGKSEPWTDRFASHDCDAVVFTTAEALGDILAGELSPFDALATRRLRYSGNVNALMAAVAILAGLEPDAVPAPCDGSAS